MNKQERIDALRRLREARCALETNEERNLWTFEDYHKKIEDIMQRPVWTHEIAFYDKFFDELERDEPASMGEIIRKIPPDKNILIVGMEGGATNEQHTV